MEYCSPSLDLEFIFSFNNCLSNPHMPLWLRITFTISILPTTFSGSFINATLFVLKHILHIFNPLNAVFPATLDLLTGIFFTMAIALFLPFSCHLQSIFKDGMNVAGSILSLQLSLSKLIMPPIFNVVWEMKTLRLSQNSASNFYFSLVSKTIH